MSDYWEQKRHALNCSALYIRPGDPGEIVIPPGACPYPIGDYWTAFDCIARGDCGCDNGCSLFRTLEGSRR